MQLSPTLKRILLIGLFAVAIAAIAYLLYIVFFKQPAPAGVNQPVNTNQANQNGQLPNINQANQNGNQNQPTNQTDGLPTIDQVAQGGDTQGTILTPDTTTQAPSIGRDGSMRYYDAVDGKFYRLDDAGNRVQIGDTEYRNVTGVTWAPTSNQTILEFPDGSNISLNLDTGAQVTLPKEYADFSFSPQSDQIAFKYLTADPQRRVLGVSNPDGTSATSLETLGDNEASVTVAWSPTGKVVAHHTEFVDGNTQEVGFVGLNNENFRGIRLAGSGLQTQYSPDGRQLLYSSYSSATDYQPVLGIVDADGENIGQNNTSLNLSTFASKCAFAPDGASVYCGVPSQQKFGYGMEPGIVDDVADDLYKINLSTGIATKIATPVNERGQAIFTVEDLTVTRDSSRLIFRDKQSGQLVNVDLR